MNTFATDHKRWRRRNFISINFYRRPNKMRRQVVSIISSGLSRVFPTFHFQIGVRSPVISGLFSTPRSHLTASRAHYTSAMVTTNCGPLSAFYYRPVPLPIFRNHAGVITEVCAWWTKTPGAFAPFFPPGREGGCHHRKSASEQV